MATPDDTRKKEIERRYLEAARRANAIIPDGEIECFERPDFKIKTTTGLLGIEVTELLRSGGVKRPLAIEGDFEKVVRLAKEEYYREPGATPVGVNVDPSWRDDLKGKSKKSIAHALAEFVHLHRNEPSPRNPVILYQDELPEDFFGTIQMNLTGNWVSGEVGGVTNLYEIREELASVISHHNERLPEYRKRLPGCPIWLLIYSVFAVARGISIPHGLSEWTFPFNFEKALFFSCLDNNEVVEIRKGGSGETTA